MGLTGAVFCVGGLIWSLAGRSTGFEYGLDRKILFDETFRVVMSGFISLILMFCHFILPFLFLMARTVKRNPATLAVGAVIILTVHWFDMYWLTGPTLHKGGIDWSLLDLTTMLAMSLFFVGLFVIVESNSRGFRQVRHRTPPPSTGQRVERCLARFAVHISSNLLDDQLVPLQRSPVRGFDSLYKRLRPLASNDRALAAGGAGWEVCC